MTSRVSQASRSLKNKFQGPAQPQGLKRLASNAGQAARSLKNKFQGPAQASNASQAARALKNRLQQDFVVKPICSTQLHAITREAVFRNTVKTDGFMREADLLHAITRENSVCSGFHQIQYFSCNSLKKSQIYRKTTILAGCG